MVCLPANGLFVCCHFWKEASVNPPLTKLSLKKITDSVAAMRAAFCLSSLAICLKFGTLFLLSIIFVYLQN